MCNISFSSHKGLYEDFACLDIAASKKSFSTTDKGKLRTRNRSSSHQCMYVRMDGCLFVCRFVCLLVLCMHIHAHIYYPTKLVPGPIIERLCLGSFTTNRIDLGLSTSTIKYPNGSSALLGSYSACTVAFPLAPLA